MNVIPTTIALLSLLAIAGFAQMKRTAMNLTMCRMTLDMDVQHHADLHFREEALYLKAP